MSLHIFTDIQKKQLRNPRGKINFKVRREQIIRLMKHVSTQKIQLKVTHLGVGCRSQYASPRMTGMHKITLLQG